ncbi:MAG: conjugal transfer protein TraH [Rubrivivax sp.]
MASHRIAHDRGRAPTWRKAVACALVVGLQAAGLAQAADLSQQMASMFGSGTLSNATGPGVYHSQTQNIYTGGELQLRFPTRSYQLWNLTLPSITAGCGGADAFLGSFSHISSSQFKDMLQEVAKSYAGLLFKAALKSINPMIESVIGDLQKTLESFGQANGNTCAMAQSLLDATSTTTGMTSESTCVTASMYVFDEDAAAAKRRCKADQTDTNAQAKASGDPAARQMADRDLNIVWEALKPSSFSTDEKTVFMNISGTIVIYKPANNSNVPKSNSVHDPSIDSLNTLLFGNEAGSTPDTVKINGWLKCNDEDCLSPTREVVEITPFPTHARQMLEGIRDNIINGQALTPAQKAFVNMTRVPIYRMMAAGYTADSASGNNEAMDQLIDHYSKVVAYDYAWLFMRKALKELRTYVGMALMRNAVEEKQAAEMIKNVDSILLEVDRENTKALAQIRDAETMVKDLQRIEREMRASLPGAIRGMLDLSNVLRGASAKS